MHSYEGCCLNQYDSLILFKAAKMGLVPRIQRRLSEQTSDIMSGAIYIWSEQETGLKRWMDSRSWSTSRASGSFLTYQELERVPSTNARQGSTWRIKPYGLCKQTACHIFENNERYRIVAYYTKSDAYKGRLIRPSQDPRFSAIMKSIKDEMKIKEASAPLRRIRKPSKDNLRESTRFRASPNSVDKYNNANMWKRNFHDPVGPGTEPNCQAASFMSLPSIRQVALQHLEQLQNFCPNNHAQSMLPYSFEDKRVLAELNKNFFASPKMTG